MGKKKSGNFLFSFFLEVSVNKQLPRFAAGLGGAWGPGAVGAVPAGTSGCYSPPGTAATSFVSAAGPEVC